VREKNRERKVMGQMRIEIRDDSVLIDGYVNAVERDSKVLRGTAGNFIEKIKAGAFRRALERAKRTSYDVKVLLNHDYGRQLASTKDAGAQIYEDTIGLRCRCEIRDAYVVQKAKEGKLSGWSFGFIPIKEEHHEEGGMDHREIRELDLKEVSILDDSRIPAYDGTSIELRNDPEDELIELRMMDDEIETQDCSGQEQPDGIYKFENRYLTLRAL
jgi:hypothetical protein